MSCRECDKMDREGKEYPYRWGAATVAIVACEKHFLEMATVLNACQQAGKEEVLEMFLENKKSK